jgi:hypothetical protein
MPSVLRQKNSAAADRSGNLGTWERGSGLARLSSLPGCVCGVLATALLVLSACAPFHNHFREDGPSTTADLETPTSKDVKARMQPAQQPECRDWPVTTVAAESGAVTHGPLYFEDPFEDKGDGRTDETNPFDVYRLGWEDLVAFPYCYARYWGNQLMVPFSAVVTPPWFALESDGRLSRQLLGYDHDAAVVEGCKTPAPPPAAETPAPETQPAK